MNNNSVKTYTNKVAFEKVFGTIFSKYQSYIKTQDSAILVKFINYKDDNAVYEITGVKVEKKTVIYSRDKKNNSIYAILELIKKEENNIYIFKPLKVQVVVTPRIEERKDLDPENFPNHRIYVVNLMSEYILKSSLELYKNKIHGLEESVKSKLRKYFEHVRVYMIHHGNDNRMNYFRQYLKPIIIKNNLHELEKKDKIFFDYYKKEIVPNDRQLNQNADIISEITIPILYNAKIPYGFIQVNGNEVFQDSSTRLIKNTAITINKTLITQRIFPQGDERLSVYDIAKNGIGIYFSDKKCVKYFSENQLIFFELVLPDNKKVSILALVRHISIKGSVYKAGCKIVEIDALSEVLFDEYLESIGLSV